MGPNFGTGGDTYNAIIHSVGNALGMAPLMSGFGGGGYGPSGDGGVSSATPPVPKQVQVAPPKPTMNATLGAELKQRHMSTPIKGAGSAAGRGLTPGGQPNFGMNFPGAMSSDVLMNPEVQKLLAPYGVSPEAATSAAQNASPNMFITNPEAYQKHPVLAGMIERGLEGAAFTQGSRTWGEGISNVAQGMLGANAARAEKYNNQLMMPFAQAQQVANLQGINLHQQYEEAEAKRANSQAEMYNQMPEYRQGLLDVKGQAERDKADRDNSLNNTVMLIGKDPKIFNYLEGSDQTDFNQALGQYGSVLKMPSALLQGFAAKGEAAKLKADAVIQNRGIEGRKAVAGIQGQNSGRVASINNAARGAVADLHETSTELMAHDKETEEQRKLPPGSRQVVGSDGKMYQVGSAKWQADRDAQRKVIAGKVAAAQQQLPFAIPGSGMTITPKKKSTSTADPMGIR